MASLLLSEKLLFFPCFINIYLIARRYHQHLTDLQKAFQSHYVFTVDDHNESNLTAVGWFSVNSDLSFGMNVKAI